MSAPGYQSHAWTTQDWRTVKLHEDRISYEEKCGTDSTLRPGRKQLRLPKEVIQKLLRSAEGKKILRQQAEKKQRAEPGERVEWHPKIKELHAKLEEKTVKDDPSKRSKNPLPWGRFLP